jgi:hypothetical protein
MDEYRVSIEAQVQGNVEEGAEALLDVLERDAGPLGPSLAVNEAQGMLMTVLSLEAANAADAYGEAYAVWQACWEEAMPDQLPPRRLAIRAVPAAEDDAPVGAGEAVA